MDPQSADLPTDYSAFFTDMSPEDYLAEGFAGNTEIEADFIVDVFGLPSGAHLLDMGCGPGRHSRALARRGFRVTGVDFTPQFLDYARSQAQSEGVGDVTEFVLADARTFTRLQTFDGAVCLCEGAFALLSEEADNRRVLANIAKSLKLGAPFLLTTLNGYRSIRAAGKQAETTLDSVTMVETWQPEAGKVLRGRHYIVPELRALHAEAGLTVEEVWGGTAGNWGHRPLDWDEMEVMLLSRRSIE